MCTPESKIFSFLLQQNGQRRWQVFPARQGQLPVWSSSEAWRCMLLTWVTQGWFLEFRMTPRMILSELWRWRRTISQNSPRRESESKDLAGGHDCAAPLLSRFCVVLSALLSTLTYSSLLMKSQSFSLPGNVSMYIHVYFIILNWPIYFW